MEPELLCAVRTMAMAGRGLERAAVPLSLPQYRVLARIATAPERAGRLAEGVDVTKATLTGVIDALEAHGWIRRAEVAGDRRGVSLALTPEGVLVLDGAERAMCAWLARVLDRAGPGAAAEVAAAMGTLGEALSAHRRARDEALSP